MLTAFDRVSLAQEMLCQAQQSLFCANEALSKCSQHMQTEADAGALGTCTWHNLS